MTVERAIEMLKEELEITRSNFRWDAELPEADRVGTLEWLEAQSLAIVALEKMQCSTST